MREAGIESRKIKRHLIKCADLVQECTILSQLRKPSTFSSWPFWFTWLRKSALLLRRDSGRKSRKKSHYSQEIVKSWIFLIHSHSIVIKWPYECMKVTKRFNLRLLWVAIIRRPYVTLTISYAVSLKTSQSHIQTKKTFSDSQTNDLKLFPLSILLFTRPTIENGVQVSRLSLTQM